MSGLGRDEARAFYDRFGARQDRQGFYEDRPLAELVEHGAFGRASAVVELGCGTGRFAERLLGGHLPQEATYLGVDASATMASLARRRLARFGRRARVVLTDGSLELPLPGGSCDRFVSTYVLDLLSEEDARRAVAEAGRLLPAGGLVCLAGLSSGCGPLSRAVAALWLQVYRLRPSLVGGCRPMEILDLLPAAEWRVAHAARLAPAGIPSQAVVAERLATR